jgi:hypothetical protein
MSGCVQAHLQSITKHRSGQRESEREKGREIEKGRSREGEMQREICRE